MKQDLLTKGQGSSILQDIKFTFHILFDDLFLNWFSTHVSDDRKYVCGRRLYACIILHENSRALIREKLHHCQGKKTWWAHCASFQSLPKINHTLITRLICIQWKFAIKVLLIKILLLFFLSTTEVFTCSKVINTFKRHNSWTDLFWKSSKFNLSQAFFTKHVWLWSVPYSQFPRCLLGTPGSVTPFYVLNMKKNGLQIMSLAAYASGTDYGIRWSKVNQVKGWGFFSDPFSLPSLVTPSLQSLTSSKCSGLSIRASIRQKLPAS